MKTRIAAFATIAALSLAAPGIALAQDRPPPGVKVCPKCGHLMGDERCPQCGTPVRATPPGPSDSEDRRLDEALRRAYGDPNGARLPEPTERAPEPRLVPPPTPPSDMEDDDRFKIRVGAVAAHWAAQILDATVRSRQNNGSSDSGRLKLDGSGGSVADLGFAETQTYRGWIDLGRWFSIQGGGRHTVFRDQSSASANSFNFGSQSFAGAYSTKFEITSVDLDLAFHPVMCDWGQLDLTLGARYVASTVQFSATGGQIAPVFAGPVFFPFPGGGPPLPGPGPFGGLPAQAASQSIETAMPMIGIGGTFRPVHIRELSVELYARTRIGGIAFGNDDGDHRGRRGGFQNQFQNQNPQDRQRNVDYSFEGEVGVSILLFQMIGVSGGYHFEAVSLEKTDSGTTKNADWRVGGPFLGLVGEF
jgi:hypothetical protein